MDAFTGQLAALGTALSFSFGSTLFTLSGRKIGSPLVNRTRLIVALILILTLHLVLTGAMLPADATTTNVFWLAVSGVIGLALGDAVLFHAFVMIGPRLSMLMMALAPVLATVMAWVFLTETLSAQELFGIGLTISGIAMVVLERSGGTSQLANLDGRGYLIGLLFAFGGAVGQAGGLVTARLGLVTIQSALPEPFAVTSPTVLVLTDFNALSGLVIRMSAAVVLVWGYTIVRGQAATSIGRLRKNPRAFGMLSLGAVIGPVLGVWLSLIAVQRAPVGIASTLMSLTPIFLIPISRIIFDDRVTRRAIVGTLVAVGGTALLFL